MLAVSTCRYASGGDWLYHTCDFDQCGADGNSGRSSTCGSAASLSIDFSSDFVTKHCPTRKYACESAAAADTVIFIVIVTLPVPARGGFW